MEKRRAISPLSTIFSIYLLTSGVKLHIHLLNVVVRFIVFLNSANLICRGTDISKYSRESLGLRDNESRLYLKQNCKNLLVALYGQVAMQLPLALTRQKFVCVEVLRPSQPNRVMSNAVSLPNHTFTGQA